MSNPRLAGIAAFLLGVFVLVPVFINMTGRWDFYYTLTSVALLAVAAAGVWLTFYIGRINIGQGAYALTGGYVSAILITQYGVNFWLTLPLAGLSLLLQQARQPRWLWQQPASARALYPWRAGGQQAGPPTRLLLT